MWGIFLLLVLLIPLLAVVLDSQLGRALARRVEGNPADEARVARLEGEVDRLTAEVERLQEQAEFTTRLLEERGGGAAADRPGGSRLPGAGGGSSSEEDRG